MHYRRIMHWFKESNLSGFILSTGSTKIFCKTLVLLEQLCVHELFSQLPFLQVPVLQSQSLFPFFSIFFPQFSRLYSVSRDLYLLFNILNEIERDMRSCSWSIHQFLPIHLVSSLTLASRSLQTLLNSTSAALTDVSCNHLPKGFVQISALNHLSYFSRYLGYLTSILAATSYEESTFAHIITLHLAFRPSVCQSLEFIQFNVNFYHTKHF